MNLALARNVRSMSCHFASVLTGEKSSGSREAGNILYVLQIAASNLLTTQSSTRSWWKQQALQYSALAESHIESDSQVRLTESAVKKLRELTRGEQTTSFLRVTVEAGGCSGFSYKFNLDTSLRAGDRVFEAGGVRLVTDDVSLEFVRGAKVDYTQELIKSAFEVIDNPNADKGCGCGTSFSPK